MPAVSKSQRRFLAMCEHGVPTQTPCPNMTHQQLHDFAATSEKGLPKRALRPKGSPPFTDQEHGQGYRRLGKGL